MNPDSIAAPADSSLGLYSPGTPDRDQLSRMYRLASFALGGIRKPALAPRFEITARQLQQELHDWTHMPDGRRSLKQVAALLATRDQLIREVQAYFTRQRKFPFYKGMHIEQYRGIPAHDEDGLLAPGLHHCDWDEFFARFATSRQRRQQALSLLAAMHLYQAAGCRVLDVGGSFVTAKSAPTDIDCRAVPQGLQQSRLHPILRFDRENLTPDDQQFSRLCRQYFGLDIGFAEQELHRRTFIDIDWQFPAECGDCPPARGIGVVRIDMSGSLPPADGFVPFAWCPPKNTAIADFIVAQCRRRLPQHWQPISDEVFESYGFAIKRNPWLRNCSSATANDEV